MNTILKMIDRKIKIKNKKCSSYMSVNIRKKKGQKHKVAFFIAWSFDYIKKKVCQNDNKKR